MAVIGGTSNMKRIISSVFIVLIVVILCSCGAKNLTWQEQYDLGVRYLSEGNYEEAIIAFTAAIEIDPKQALAYIGRGDAYSAQTDTENLTLALSDYELAINIDTTLVDVYLKAAKICEELGNKNQAIAILEDGIAETDDEQLQKALLTLTDVFRSHDYQDIEDLSPEVRILVETLVDEAVGKDSDAVFQSLLNEYLVMVNEGKILGSSLRTEVNEYKISLTHGTDYDTAQEIGFVEVRPESGEAHYYMAMNDQGELVSIEIHGECVNWNWNGAFEKKTNYYRINDVRAWLYESGRCVNALLDGEVKSIKPGNEQFNETASYSLGKKLGEIQNSNDRVITIDREADIDYYKEKWVW